MVGQTGTAIRFASTLLHCGRNRPQPISRQPGLDRASGWRDAVVGLKPAILRAVLVSVGPPWEIRGGLQLIFGHLGPIAPELLVVVELVPGQSVVLRPEAEEALKGDDHEGDLTAHLFDDQALHLPDPDRGEVDMGEGS